MLSVKEENKPNFYEHFFYNILSSLILIGTFFFLNYIGIKGYAFQAFIILVFFWGSLIFYPLISKSKTLEILFIRFMKDVPMMFPAMMVVIIFQPIFLGRFTTLDFFAQGLILFSEINETFFYISFTVVLLFASNCHYLFGWIFSTKTFQPILIKYGIYLGPNKNENYEAKIKILTYNILLVQSWIFFLPLLILLRILENVTILRPILYFVAFIFFLSLIFGIIGFLRLIVFKFEFYILKKHKIKF